MNEHKYDKLVRSFQGILDHAFEVGRPLAKPGDEHALKLRVESLVDRACTLSAELGDTLKELEQCLANETVRPD